MLVDVKTVLLGFDGKPLEFSKSANSESEELQLADAIMLSLLQGIDKNTKDLPKDKYKRFMLCDRCQHAKDGDGQMTLTSDEVQLIKNSAALVLPIITYGRVIQIIEPDEKV